MTLNLPVRTYAVYGCADTHRGRWQIEGESAPQSKLSALVSRTAFQRDRDRIIHSNGFRRMKHKTQLFVYHEGDYFCTRLTHSLEVAQIARTAARALAVNEDLAEAIALAHDLGHTPFGHAGEEALNEVMAPYGGFDHNEQTLRVVTQLEERYAGFNGLNLTWETIEGLTKHNGPVSPEALRPTVKTLNASLDLQLQDYASVEAQIANLSDDIAYLSHDFEDGLRAGLISLEALEDLPIVGETVKEIYFTISDRHMSRVGYAITRAVITKFVQDLIETSLVNLESLNPESPEDIRKAGYAVVQFSEEADAQLQALREFLFTHMWRHYKVNRMTSKTKRVLKQLFERLLQEPNLLPRDWADRLVDKEEAEQARIVADYVASMTDRYALLEYERIFEMGPILV